MTIAAETWFQQQHADRLRHLREILAAGETNPARVLALFEYAERQNSGGGDAPRISGRLPAPTFAADFSDRTLYPECPIMPTGAPTYAFTTIAGRRTMRPFYGCFDRLALRQITDALIDHQVDAVVELGADFGQRLLSLFLAGGPNVPYFAAEPTSTGREGVAILAALQPDMDLRAVPMDVTAPDWSFLAGAQRVLVFSTLSLSAWPRLPADWFDRLATTAPAVWGMHYEAVGHQLRRDNPTLDWFYAQAEDQRFNIDLLPRLVDAHNRGIVHCDLLSPDLYDLSTGFPISVAWWRAGAAEAAPA